MFHGSKDVKILELKSENNGRYKKTTRNCFFNEHFNIENDGGTLQISTTNSWKQQTERWKQREEKKYLWIKKQSRNTTANLSMWLTNTSTINLAMQLDKRNKMHFITEENTKLNTIRDNEFDVGYSGVVNAHR